MTSLCPVDLDGNFLTTNLVTNPAAFGINMEDEEVAESWEEAAETGVRLLCCSFITINNTADCLTSEWESYGYVAFAWSWSR